MIRAFIYRFFGLHFLQSSHHPKYRPDIDGLRAIAVSIVILYHVFPEWIKGGFIGVDVFFVISGFLISSILLKSADQNKLDIRKFYFRRIRRIFPALLLVITSCYIFGWFFLLPSEYKQLSEHVVGGASFISNLIYWNESGYFDSTALSKPLLHLWSLGIEEQFYILWPVVIYLVYKLRLNFLSFTIFMIFSSFIYNLYQTHHNIVADFYSPQTRFWELIVGAVLGYSSLRKWKFTSMSAQRIDKIFASIIFKDPINNDGRTLNNIQSFFGFILLITGILTISKNDAFPGWEALMPTLGSIFIISAGPLAWINRIVLSSRILVGIGLISFPLYLWHWPLLSFSSILNNGSGSVYLKLLMICGSFILAWLTYSFIEKPLRFGENLKIKTLLLCFGMAIIIMIASITYLNDGFPERIGNRQMQTLDQYDYLQGKGEAGFWGSTSCFLLEPSTYKNFEANNCEDIDYPNRPKIFLLGDSYSAYLSLGLRSFLQQKHYNLIQFSAAGCTPLSLKDKSHRCYDINNYINEQLINMKPDVVILFADYMGHGNTKDYGETQTYDQVLLQKTQDLKNLGIKKVLILGQMPHWEGSLPKVLARKFLLKGKPLPTRTYKGIVPLSLEWGEKMKNIKFPDNVTYISMEDFLCHPEGCLTMVGPNLETDLLMFDDFNHLTKAGAIYLTNELLSPYFMSP